MATQDEYDSGQVTERERGAAKNQITLGKQNAEDVRTQLANQIATYDFANRQNRALADTQLKQNSQKTSAERFEAARNLQNSALGLLGTMGGAMNGSSTGNLMQMLQSRNDADNNNYWQQLQENNNSVENSYQDSFNQNQVAKRDAITSAEKSIRDIESDLAANLNNINPNLFVEPGTGDTNLNSGNVWTDNANSIQQNNAKVSGYIMPDNRAKSTRNTLGGNSYFSQLVNGFNRRQ